MTTPWFVSIMLSAFVSYALLIAAVVMWAFWYWLTGSRVQWQSVETYSRC